jgi:tripartite-type tricarboxylate transporter receptor subunit TctC
MRLAGVLLACSLCVMIASHLWGQQAVYPTKPVNVLVGFAPGGMVDVSAHLLAAKTGAGAHIQGFR